jgi:tetratricopeptide (TPR) repeat protein
MQVWRVLGPSSVDSRFEALRAAGAPLVDREEEIALLMRHWQRAKTGEGCVVLISGEPGIGKSRIAQTVLERVSGEPHTRMRYFCSPHHQDSALYPSITQLERAAGFRREDTAEQRLDRLAAVLALGTNDLSEAVPLIADLLSVPTGDRYPPLNLTPQKRKEKTLQALLAQLEGLATRRPVLVVFEDAHWSDPTSRESLELTVDRVPTLPVLLMITYRPEFTPPWVGHPHVTLLSLSRLPRRQRAEMIMRVTRGKALPKEIADQIIDRTDGVPLFVEELTKAIVESGVLVDSGDRYTVCGPLPPLVIPTSLHGSLLARLDRRAPARELAQIAAALGRQFSHELISAIAAMPQQKLDDALDQLVNAELIFRRGTPPDAEYTFKHALVQDTAYSTLLRGRRQYLHGRIAMTLESQFPDVVAAQPQLMAQHCAQAGLNEKAIGYWLKAGQQAVARSAMTEAVAQLQKGLDLLASLPESPGRRQQEDELLLALGHAVLAAKGYAAPALLYGQCVFRLVRSELRPALSLAERIEQTGAAQDDIAVRLLGRVVHGQTRFFLGEFVAARDLFERCHESDDSAHRAVFRAVMADDPYARMLAFLAQTLTSLGYIDQGRSRIDAALTVARRLGNVHLLAVVLNRAAFLELATDSPDEALRHAAEMMALSDAHGFALWLAYGTVHRGAALTALGQAQQGLTLITKGLSMLHATGAVLGTPWMLTRLAEAHARLGRPGEGLNCLIEAAQIIEATDERNEEAELHRLRGDLLNVTGDRAAAERNYHRALAVARRQSTRLFELRAATSLARLWRDRGKRTEAHNLLAPIYSWFTEGLDTPVLTEAKALLDQMV